jgi:DNA invertase Pin-like site-specific DNA recombinase
MVKHKARRAAIYLRVSTDTQTTENQRHQLEAIAERRGWPVVKVYEDRAISGAKSRNGRPALDQMMKDASRREFDVVMSWAVDRLGRSLVDLLSIIQDLEATGVDLYLEQQNVDTTTPSGRLLFHITGAFAEFERAIIRERINAGLARAKAKGVKLGRRKVAPEVERKVRRKLAKGTGVLKTARMLGIGTGTVQRIKTEMRKSATGAAR